MKIEEMADIFLNSANFASHAFLTLAPSSGYALNLKALIKVSKVSWTSQFSYEILRSSLKRQFDKTNFISPKSTPQKSPVLLGLNDLVLLKEDTEKWFTMNILWWQFQFRLNKKIILIFSADATILLKQLEKKVAHNPTRPKVSR